jgi:nucleotide-binding universal stress UspA family protein
MQENLISLETSARSNATFLVGVSETAESDAALRFACLRAKRRNARVAMLHVIEPADFHGILSVSDVIRQEQHEAAQELLQGKMRQSAEWGGIAPGVLLREGRIHEEIIRATLENGDIIAVVLGAHYDSKRGSKLIGALLSRIGQDLLVPLILVPGNLTDAQIEMLV